MARAKTHYLPGYIWHITHRCHKREFLLGYAKDRHRYLQWLGKSERGMRGISSGRDVFPIRFVSGPKKAI